MRNLEFTGNLYGNNITIKQVQKRTAKKLYEQGVTIYVQSSNFAPFGLWSSCYDFNKDRMVEGYDTFESTINSFEYYNCDSERGNYASFYIAK